MCARIKKEKNRTSFTANVRRSLECLFNNWCFPIHRKQRRTVNVRALSGQAA